MNFEDLSPAEQEEMKETFAMWRKPPEYFDKVVNSGMYLPSSASGRS